MKLSEAIRLGSMLKPQAFENYETKSGTCALGAALDAHGFSANTLHERELQAFEVAHGLNAPAVCPICGAAGTLGGRVVHLNDEHKWTRERIADWIAESIELASPVETPIAQDEEKHDEEKSLETL